MPFLRHFRGPQKCSQLSFRYAFSHQAVGGVVQVPAAQMLALSRWPRALSSMASSPHARQAAGPICDLHWRECCHIACCCSWSLGMGLGFGFGFGLGLAFALPSGLALALPSTPRFAAGSTKTDRERHRSAALQAQADPQHLAMAMAPACAQTPLPP